MSNGIRLTSFRRALKGDRFGSLKWARKGSTNGENWAVLSFVCVWCRCVWKLVLRRGVAAVVFGWKAIIQGGGEGIAGVPLGVVAGGGPVIRGGTINIVVVEGKRVIGGGGSNQSWQLKVVTGEGWRQLPKVGAAGPRLCHLCTKERGKSKRPMADWTKKRPNHYLKTIHRSQCLICLGSYLLMVELHSLDS